MRNLLWSGGNVGVVEASLECGSYGQERVWRSDRLDGLVGLAIILADDDGADDGAPVIRLTQCGIFRPEVGVSGAAAQLVNRGPPENAPERIPAFFV